MKHNFVVHLPFCSACGMLFQTHAEFSAVCPGQLVDEPLPEGTPPPTPLPLGADRPAQPGPRVMYAANMWLEMVRDHYDAGSKLSQAEGRNAARDQRLVARSLAREAGVDPDAVVIAPGTLPKTPKGAVLIDRHILNAVPYWALFLNDARVAIEAAEAAKDGKELPHGEL